jgi:hypothetical protein
MALSNAAMDTGAAAIQAGYGYAQLHTAAAGSAGTSNVATSGRQPISWASPSGAGSFGLVSALNFTGGAASGPVYSVTIWSASTGGTFGGEFVLTGDTAFNSLGQYTVSSLGFTGSAT